VPLITASILGKKLCADLDALVLDVKVGRGAFMTSLEDARELARSLVDVAAAAGLRTTAVLTAMDQPLGYAVGNALEAAEAFQMLCGSGPNDVLECTVALGREMLVAGGLERNAHAAERRLLYAIRSGAAAAKMEAAIAAQHGDPRVVREPDRLPKAPSVVFVRSRASGFVCQLDARKVAQAALQLGAGRSRLGDPVDPAAGVMLRKKAGDTVQPGDILAELHGREAAELETAARVLESAYALGAGAPSNAPLVLETLRASGSGR
jgi:thymidine phosphorylase